MSDVFGQIANTILTTSSKSMIPLGESLFNEFTDSIKFKYKALTANEKKFVTVFYKDKRDIFSIETQALSIKLTINAKAGTLKDKNGILRDVSKVGHWGNGDYQIKLEDNKNFDALIEIIGQIL
jgi:predicted transport protein